MAFLPPLAVFIIFNLAIFFFHGSAKIIYEDGYTVTTVFDGNKLKISPHSLSLRRGFNDAVLLDSSNSLFYTLSLPLSQESVTKEFAGSRVAGFSDGDASTATFKKPESFAVDLKGNVYVADRRNFAVRKISKSGTVTTIAGGHSKAPGHPDVPGQNATFSSGFELTFVPDMCALLILDYGHKLIRRISLKQENCVHSEAGVGDNLVWPWIAAVVVSCLVGLFVGLAIRPYLIMPNELGTFLNTNKSQMFYLMNLGRQTQMRCFDSRSAVANPALKFMRVVTLVHSHLSLLLVFMFKRVRSGSGSSSVDKNYVSLLDVDNSSSSQCVSSQKYDEQLKDLISFSGQPGASKACNDILREEPNDGDHHGQIDDLMHANIANFAAANASKSSALEGPFLGVSTVVKRK